MLTFSKTVHTASLGVPFTRLITGKAYSVKLFSTCSLNRSKKANGSPSG